MKNVLFIFTLFILFFSAIGQASAFGQITEPIKINDAIRGEQIHQEITVVNTDPRTIYIDLAAAGAVKDWVLFYYPDQLDRAIATTSMPANSTLHLTAVFSIPKDLPNGEYKGVVSVTKEPEDSLTGGQSGASIAQKIDRAVSIRISEQETVKLEASVIPAKFDLAPNEPLDIRIIYDNQGNISLKPSISFKIIDNDRTYYNVIFPYPEGEEAVGSQALREIPAFSVPTAGIPVGDYSAVLGFRRGDQTILEKHFTFSIQEPGASGAGGWIGSLLNMINIGLMILAVLLVAIAAYLFRRNSALRQSISKTGDAE